MIQHLTHNKIDFKLWDAHLAHCINTNVYAQHWYLNTVCPKWEALIVGNYDVMVPLPVKTFLGVSYLVQPLWVQQLGVFYKAKISEALFHEIIQFIKKKYWRVNFSFNASNLEFLQTHVGNNYVLKLQKPFSEIKKAYKNKDISTARNKSGLEIKTTDIITAIQLFEQSKIGKTLQPFNNKAYKILLNLVMEANKHGKSHVLACFKNNVAISAVVILEFNSSFTLLFTGTGNEGRKERALLKLLDWFIGNNCEMHTYFDFEGSNNNSIAKFYASWGAQLEQYPTLIYKKLI